MCPAPCLPLADGTPLWHSRLYVAAPIHRRSKSTTQNLSCLAWQGTELETAALKEGEYVAVRRFVRLLERGGDAKVVFSSCRVGAPSTALPCTITALMQLKSC